MSGRYGIPLERDAATPACLAVGHAAGSGRRRNRTAGQGCVMNRPSHYVLTASAPAHPELVLRVHEWIADTGGHPTESRMLPHEGQALLRVAFTADPDPQILRDKFAALGDRFAMRWQLRLTRHRLLVMVSHLTYAGAELIGQWQAGLLGGDVVAVVSDRLMFRPLVTSAGLPYHRIHTNTETSAGHNTEAVRQAETRLLDLVDQTAVDTVVLACYQPQLSPWWCGQLADIGVSVINLHQGGVATKTTRRHSAA
jgi:formyltetrahydrofolate deformylase